MPTTTTRRLLRRLQRLLDSYVPRTTTSLALARVDSISPLTQSCIPHITPIHSCSLCLTPIHSCSHYITPIHFCTSVCTTLNPSPKRCISLREQAATTDPTYYYCSLHINHTSMHPSRQPHPLLHLREHVLEPFTKTMHPPLSLREQAAIADTFYSYCCSFHITRAPSTPPSTCSCTSVCATLNPSPRQRTQPCQYESKQPPLTPPTPTPAASTSSLLSLHPPHHPKPAPELLCAWP